VTKVEFYVDGTNLIGSDSTSSYSVNSDTTKLPNGTHAFTARAYDAAGNWSISANVTVTVSNSSLDAGAWVEAFGGAGNDSGSVVTLDGGGNIIMAGYFSGTSVFGGGSLTSAGGTDLVLAKYNNAGAHQWSYRFGGTATEMVTGIASDGSGNVFICGYYVGNANFGGNTFTGAGQQDAFIAKYSAQGQHLWSQGFGGASIDMFNGLVVDSQGNVIVTGWFQGTNNFGGATFVSTYGAAPNVVVAKYSPTGSHLWSKTFTAGNGNYANAIAIDKRTDNVVLTGSFYSWIDFGGGRLTAASATYQDIFVAKLNASGSYVWAKRYGGTQGERGTTVAVDGNGDVVVGGMFYLQTDLGGGPIIGGAVDQDMFLAKYAGVDGTYLPGTSWTRGLTGNDGGWVNSVSCDSQNNVLVTGYYYGLFNFGSQSLSSNATSYDGFVAKYSPSGSPIWAKTFGSAATDGGTSVVADATSHPIVSGYFSGTAGFEATTATSLGSYDAFVLRLNP
jgi:hypothetical protein